MFQDIGCFKSKVHVVTTILYTPPNTMDQTRFDPSETVKVVVRCRPLNEKEIAAGYGRCVFVDCSNGTVEVHNPNGKRNDGPRRFRFDAVYDENSMQKDLYNETFRGLIDNVLVGFNGTVFAYGQTGTGKTFTIQGFQDNPELRGIMPNSFVHIFDEISKSMGTQYLVRASYLEIYKEEIRDLLRRDQSKHLEIREKPDSGIYIKDLSSVLTKSIDEILKVMTIGYQNRAVGATNMNEHSSRSHAIFIITVECCRTGTDGKKHIRVGKLNLVDLAGSERQSKTLSEGERLKEATKINLSLSTLGNVISALVDGKSTHIPYRDSKLTRLLQDSLGGNSKTIMIANIGPATYNYEETINTLRYSNRAKNIRNKPKINEDPKDALLKEYQEEINRLKSLLQNSVSAISRQPIKQDIQHKSQRKHALLDGSDVDTDFVNNGSDTELDSTSIESYLKEQQVKLLAEKNEILNDHSLVAVEKSRMLNDLEMKEKKIQEEQLETRQLESKLRAMESKLLCGDKSIAEHTRMQEVTLAQQRIQLAEQKRREREIVARMEEEVGSMANLQEGFTSLKQEVEVNTRKLKRLFEKLQEVKEQTSDIQEEHTIERQEHEKIQDQLTREVKLQLLILENFIPTEEKEKLEKRIYFDGETERWQLKPLFQSTIENTNISISSRFQSEHLLNLDMDLTGRTTNDYEPPELAPQVVAALEVALQDEEDLELDGRY
ncbi:Kinesin-like protein isoform 2 [Schistosoma japonicum]|uniref:Kinesin-like protein n=1 Tax=Schistosoma japonicum TaxID=6182 RepID=A0A4Z2D8Z4_SCHJA|nr:Kinesin-II 95 kDa subunit [Schistosoma japonicum]TNN12971.1 Kinesin-like protein isoform 2 [Schistosoma japonicum]